MIKMVFYHFFIRPATFVSHSIEALAQDLLVILMLSQPDKPHRSAAFNDSLTAQRPESYNKRKANSFQVLPAAVDIKICIEC